MDRQILSMMLLIDFPISPEFPSISQYSSEFPRIYWLSSGKAKIVYDVRKFCQTGFSYCGKQCWRYLIRHVQTSLDKFGLHQNSIKILWILKWIGNYCLMMSEKSVDFTSKQCWYFNMTEEQTCCIVHTTYLIETMWSQQMKLNQAVAISEFHVCYWKGFFLTTVTVKYLDPKIGSY